MDETPSWIKASPTALTRQESRSILVLNVWALPLWLSYRNKPRQNRIVSYIKQHKPDYVLLQEVWCSCDVNALEKRLSEYQVFRSGQKRHLMNKGGLVTLVKSTKPHESTYKYFGKPVGGRLDEIHAEKGVLLVTDNNALTLGNTHLYSPRTTGRAFTESQFREVLSLAAIYPNLVVGGDYNLTYPHRVELNAKHGEPFNIAATDATYDTRLNPLTRRGVNRFSGRAPKREAIDGLMVHGEGVKLRYSAVLKTQILSDHLGVVGLLALNDSARGTSSWRE